MDIFNGKVLPYEDEKLPTLLQYLKDRKGKNTPSRFIVGKIWLPNKFPNYQLECDKFKVNVSSRSPLGKAIDKSLTALVDSDISLYCEIPIETIEERLIKLTAGKEKCYWVSFGDPVMGYAAIPNRK
jgi:hypothetical protein